MKELQKILGSVRRAVAHYDMLRDGDSVAIGLSGGKDSLALLVSLAAMRVAVYEILFDDSLDADISVSEAVKICEKYTTKEDTAFVNGVLGSLVRQRNDDESNQSN